MNGTAPLSPRTNRNLVFDYDINSALKRHFLRRQLGPQHQVPFLKKAQPSDTIFSMVHVLILGTQHPYQVGTAGDEAAEQFEQVISEAITRLGLRGIAEEMNQEWLEHLFKVDASIGERVANSLGLSHKNCEPNDATKREIGIKSRLDARLEVFWASEIKKCFESFPILFVCGSLHAKSMVVRLEKVGLATEILWRDWPRRN